MESLGNDFLVFVCGWRLESVGKGYREGRAGKKRQEEENHAGSLFAKGFASAVVSFLC